MNKFNFTLPAAGKWLALLSCSMLFACSTAPTSTPASSPSNTITLSGNASYLQRIAMPPEAVLTVQVEDVSRADAPGIVLAKQQIPFNARQVPLAYSINIDSALVDPKHSYAIRATISVADKLRFTTTQHYPVLTPGASNQVDLLLQMVAAAPESAEKPPSTLTNTRWKLTELNGKPVSMAPNQREEIHITLASDKPSVSGFSGCNRMIGGYELDGDHLKFSQLAGTMMACVSPMMENESEFVKTLAHTTSYRISGEQLTLFSNQTVIARFSALYLK